MTKKTTLDKWNDTFGTEITDQMINLVIKSIENNMDTYSNSILKGIVTKDSLPRIWDNFPSTRKDITLMLINVSEYSWKKFPDIEKQEARELLKRFFHQMDSEIEKDPYLFSMRINSAAVCDPNIDWLERYKESLIKSEFSEHWKEAALKHSRDEKVYSYFYDQIKNGKGAIETKTFILSKAFDKSIFPEDIVRRVAHSSPISLKRLTVAALADKIKRNLRDQIYSTQVIDSQLKKEYDRLQELAMLFVGNDDYQILNDLSSCLSRTNLTWIVSAASKYEYIASQVMRRINENNK